MIETELTFIDEFPEDIFTTKKIFGRTIPPTISELMLTFGYGKVCTFN